MRNIVTLAFFFSLSTSIAQTAKVKIDVNRKIGEIDPKVYGVFMEPIEFSGKRMGMPDTVRFNTLYGNLYDPTSPLANEYVSVKIISKPCVNYKLRTFVGQEVILLWDTIGKMELVQKTNDQQELI